MASKSKKDVIAIVGSSGFLGGAFTRYCLIHRMKVIGFDKISAGKPFVSDPDYRHYRLDACQAGLKPILKKWQPKYIVNLAGNAYVPYSITDPQADFASGPALFINLLESVRRFSPKTRVLLISSAAVYGQPKQLPMKETLPIRPISPYGYHKRMCEMLADEYCKIFGVRTATARIFSAYGAGLCKQIFWDICRRCRDEGRITLSGTGNETRDFIHQIDICAALYLILKKGTFTGDIYNVACGRETRIKDLAKLIARSYGLKEKCLSFTGLSRKGDPARWRADISRIQALGFKQSIDFEKGALEYSLWFSKNHPK